MKISGHHGYQPSTMGVSIVNQYYQPSTMGVSPSNPYYQPSTTMVVINGFTINQQPCLLEFSTSRQQLVLHGAAGHAGHSIEVLSTMVIAEKHP